MSTGVDGTKVDLESLRYLLLNDVAGMFLKYHLHYQTIKVNSASDNVLILGYTGNEELFAACSLFHLERLGERLCLS